LKKAISFALTQEQGILLTEEFNKKLQRRKLLLGDDFDANTKRLGMIPFRLFIFLKAENYSRRSFAVTLIFQQP
jgi:hypothetical protein